MKWFRLLGFFLILTAILPAWAHAAGTLACELPAELTTPSEPLSQVGSALATRGGLNILALGSGSTVGASVAGSAVLNAQQHENSFPYRMVDALRSMRPGLHFDLRVEGARHMTADEMFPILQRELADHHYDLVFWQTGTVEAVQGLRPDALHNVLQDGADAVEEAHADLVLIDPQFSRFLRANADLTPYETVLEQMTDTQGVTLFHRYDLTREWVRSGEVDLERASPDQRDKAIAKLNECLGQALAQYVLAGASEH